MTRGIARCAAALIGCLTTQFAAAPVAAQTVSIVGTAHVSQLNEPASVDQFSHTVQALASYEPTQVCVEMLSGERIEDLAEKPERWGRLAQTTAAGNAIRVGSEQQRLLEVTPSDARTEGAELLARWDDLETEERGHVIQLQLASFDFASAVLNWSYLDGGERDEIVEALGHRTVEALDRALSSGNEVFGLGLPVARQVGLHELCNADALKDESRGIAAARKHGSRIALEQPGARARIEKLVRRMNAAWQPGSGEAALTRLLRFYNGEEFAALDRDLEWETMREFDNEAGALTRRVMYWHARTAEISAELFRALARGKDERVLFLVGAAHRSFLESALQAQPWLEVVPAVSFLGMD